MTSEPSRGAVAIAASRYNAEVVQRLLDGAVARLDELGTGRDQVTVALVPGAWELPLACRRLAEARAATRPSSAWAALSAAARRTSSTCAARPPGGSPGVLSTPASPSASACSLATPRAGDRALRWPAREQGRRSGDAALEMAGLLAALPRRRLSAAPGHRRLGLPRRRAGPPGCRRRLAGYRHGADRRRRPSPRRPRCCRGPTRRGNRAPGRNHPHRLPAGRRGGMGDDGGRQRQRRPDGRRRRGAPLHLSTDVVFDGRLGRPYREDDLPTPVTQYGRAKARPRGWWWPRRGVADRADIADRRRRRAQPSRADGAGRRRGAGPAWRSTRTRFAARSPSPIWLERSSSSPPARPPASLHVAGADAVSRHELAVLVTGRRDLAGSRSADRPDPRPLDCRLDCRRAAGLLGGMPRGVRELYGASRSTSQAATPSRR